MPRVLETVLTGRNLLSPVLATAARDVAAFDSTVTGAHEKAATSATMSARAQQAASGQVAASSARASTAASTGASAQSAAADKIAASNVKASTSAQASASTQMRAHAKAAESATVAARVQETANRSLATSNGMLTGSLTPLTASLGAVALGIGYAAFRGMEFDSAMSQVQAASQASAGDLERLRDAAIEQGAKTKYSAEEAAQGITEMAKAGVSTADVLGGGLAGALNLAAAGQISVAEAAETGATALSVFGLKGDQMSHVADLLAAGAGKAQGSVGDMSAALNQSALVANQTGLSIEDTAGALAMFASNGLVGSDAGTSFKTMLQALTPNSDAAAAAMDQLGLRAYDAQGNFVGLEAYAGQLKDGLSGLSVEQQNATLKTIFGSDAVRAAAILYKQGSDGVRAWRDNVNDAGYAQQQAAQLTDNLKGDLERLGGAFDSTMTTIGSGLQGPLRGLTQGLTGILDAGSSLLGFFTDLPGGVQLAIGAFGLWSVAGGDIMKMFGPLKESASGFFSTFNEALGYAQENGDGLGDVLGSMGEVGWDTAKGGLKALAGAIGPALGMAAATYLATELVGAFMSLAHAGDGAAKEVRDLNDELEGAETNDDRFQTIEVGLESLRKKAAEAKDILDSYDDQNLFNKYVWSGIGEPGELADAEKSLESYNDQIERMEEASQRGTQSTEVLADKLRLSKTEVTDLADKYGIDLTGSLEETQQHFEEMYTKEYGTTPVDAANAVGEAVTSAKEQTEEALEAQKKWLESLQQTASGFVDPLAAYSGLLEEKKAAEQAAAEATAASTEDSKDSWKDYVDDVDVSLTELADRLQTQIDNQLNWRNNIAQIAQWAGVDVAQHLAQMGEEGVDLVAKMADGSSAEAQRMAGMIRQDIQLGGMAWTSDLDTSMKVMAEIGKQGGAATAKSVADALGLGVIQVADIAAQYGAKIADGINPVLMALGRDQVRTNARIAGGASLNALGLADGAVLGGGESHVAQIAPAGAWRVWAEPETGGEAYIPLAAGKRGRSLDIWRETGKRLRAPEAEYFAAGGFSSAADVPRPYSTAPYGPPISTAADGVMQKGFDEVRAWLDANSASGPIGGGAAGGSWQALWSQVHAQFPTARKTSDFRPGDPGYHGRGKAVDVAGARPGDAAAMLAINRWAAATMGANLAELIYTPGINLYQGKPHTYNAATRADHWDHVHLAAREKGGPVWPGQNFLVGENGPEIARFNAPATVYPNGTSPAAMPGYGAVSSGGGGGTTTVVINSPITFSGPVYGGDAMRRIAEDVVTERDNQLKRDERRWMS